MDDDRAQSNFLSAHLMRRGYDVSAAATGEEAIRMFRVFDPALVLLDADARGMDGMENLGAAEADEAGGFGDHDRQQRHAGDDLSRLQAGSR